MAPFWSFLASLALSSFLWSAPGLRIELLAEEKTIVPGTPFQVALHIIHEEGFHTYWRNPGIVGLPTTLKWQLPQGFTASEIQWPFPELTKMAAYPCYGYERDILLLTTITPPAQIAQKLIPISASATWMCCAKNCHPGFQKFTLSLPVAARAKTNKKLSPLFEKSRAQLPEKNHGIDLTVTPMSPDTIALSIPPQHTEDIYFFSADGQVDSQAAQVWKKNADRSVVLTLKRSQFSPAKTRSLPGVLKVGNRHLAINPIYPRR
jgi:thiol:disulfide interchange protein DsbD